MARRTALGPSAGLPALAARRTWRLPGFHVSRPVRNEGSGLRALSSTRAGVKPRHASPVAPALRGGTCSAKSKDLPVHQIAHSRESVRQIAKQQNRLAVQGRRYTPFQVFRKTRESVVPTWLPETIRLSPGSGECDRSAQAVDGLPLKPATYIVLEKHGFFLLEIPENVSQYSIICYNVNSIWKRCGLPYRAIRWPR